MDRSIARVGLTFLLLAIAFCAAKSCVAEDQTKRNDGPLSYRRIYVPASNPESWPRGEDKFLPVEASEFNAWVASANQSIERSTADGIEAAEYTGRLDGEGHLTGHGRWDVVLRSREPAFVQFPSPSIVITNLRWKGSEKQPVQFGVWGKRGGVPTEWGLQVSQTGSIEFDWSIQGHQQNNILEIPWRVPNGVSNRVVLDLPEGEQPAFKGAAVLESTRIEPTEKGSKPTQRWKLALPAYEDNVLRITRPDSDKNASIEQPSLQEAVAYQIRKRGVNISADWKLDFRDLQQHDLNLPLPNGVELISVSVNGQATNWRVERGESSARGKAIIALPSRSSASLYRIEITAWQPLTVDRPWQLPILHPESVFWSSGEFSLEVSRDLELRNVSTTDCVQQSVGTTGVGNSSEQLLSFTAYSPSVALEVRISGHDPEATIRMGSSLALADPDVTGKVATEWNVSQGSLYHFSGELSPGWNIEAVETMPSDALAEWFVDHSGERRTLQIQLTHPAAPGHSVTVIINGRLQRTNLTDPLMTDSLRVVRWDNARVQQHLVAFQSTEPFVAQMIGDLPAVPRNNIGDSERALFDLNANQNQVVDLARAGANAGLRLDVRRAEYRAEVELDSNFANNELRQNWQISARPTANAIDRVLVYATEPLGENVHWLERSTNNPLAAELLSSNDPRRKELPKDGEAWLLRLPQPTTKLVELGLSITGSLTKRRSIALLSLPDAVEQRGSVFIHGPTGNALAIDSAGLAPMPVSVADAAASPADSGHSIRAAYRYAPSECLAADHCPRLALSPPAESGVAPFIVRHFDLESFFWPDGRGQHCATYDLMSDGAAEFRPQLPSDVKLSAVTANHQLVDAGRSESKAAVLPIPISAASRHNIIQIYFETHQLPLRSISTLAAPEMLRGLPVVTREWNVWLPNGFVTEDETLGNSSWTQRLFGPLAKSGGELPIASVRAASNETPLRASGSQSVDHSAASLVTQTRSSAPIGESAENTSSNNTMSAGVQPGVDADHVGWHKVRRTDLADGVPTSLVVTQPGVISSWELAAAVLSFLVSCLCRIRGRALFVSCAVVACVAVVLPEPIAPLATGVLWGLLISAISYARQAWLSSKSVLTSRVGRAAVVGGTAILFVFNSRSVCADPPSSPLPSVTERVLIPVDADKKPVGSKYFVGERFLHELLNQQAAQPEKDRTWFLRDAAYVGELSDARDSTEIAVGRWSLAFTIETLARDTTLSLPLNRDEAEWQSSAMLEGVPIPIVWSERGHECTVEVGQPGKYTLTLFCTPKTVDTDDRRKLELSVPSLASAKIQVHVPALLSGVAIADANIAPTTKDASRTIGGELVQTNRIEVDWPRQKEKNSASQGLNITELKWLRIGAHGTELETKYILEGGSRRPPSLSIKYDPRWKPTTRLQAASGDQTSEVAGGLRTLTLPLGTTGEERQEVIVRWKLEDAPTIGVLRLPPIYLSSAPVAQRWLALSVGSNFECALGDNNTSTATTNEFMTRWGESTDALPITTAVANYDADRVWTVAIRPREADSSIRENLHLAVGVQQLRVIYEANVVPANAEQFGLRLTVPENLTIDDITLAEAERKIPTRWVRDGDEHINVFFANAARSDYRLTMSGTIPSDVGTPIRVPRISASVASSAEQVQLYRDDDVDVKLQGFPSAADSKTAAAELPPIQWLVRPLGVFRLNDKEVQSARLVVSRAQTPLTGDMVTSLTYEAGVWWATLNLHLKSGGDLDVVRLHFSPECIGPFEVESSVPETKEAVASGDGGQSLAIRFSSTIARKNDVELKIRSPLAIHSGDMIEVPTIATVPPLVGRRYLNLPTTVEDVALTWSNVGVQPTKVPQNLLQGPSGKHAQYEIVKEPIAVSSHLGAKKQSKPRVRLADTSVNVGSNGAQTLISSFVISPGGIAECLVQLPSGHRLLSAELDGRNALIIPDSDSKWRVALNTTQLPQVLEIISSVESKGSSNSIRELSRPTLLIGRTQLPVEVSLWSISKRSGTDPIVIVGAAPVSAIDQAALRFDRLVSIAESASTAAAEAPQTDGANWFRPWAARLAAIHQQSMSLVGQAGATATLARLPRASEEQLSRIAERYAKWLEESIDLFGNAGGPNATIASDLAMAKDSLQDQQTTYYASDGNAEKLAVQTTEPSLVPPRLKSAAVVLLILAAGLWLSKMPAIGDFLYRFPYVVGVLLGIGYWAWLTPSWLGIVVAAASASFALRFNWPGRYVRPEASTVLRSTRMS